MAELPFDPDSITVHYLREDKARTSGYVVMADIPEPYRSMISSDLVPCAVLDLPDKGYAIICTTGSDGLVRWTGARD